MSRGGCRFCGTLLQHVFLDLGMSPMANSYLKSHQLNQMEPFYPLRAFVCERCLLVQLEEFESPDHIFLITRTSHPSPTCSSSMPKTMLIWRWNDSHWDPKVMSLKLPAMMAICYRIS